MSNNSSKNLIHNSIQKLPKKKDEETDWFFILIIFFIILAAIVVLLYLWASKRLNKKKTEAYNGSDKHVNDIIDNHKQSKKMSNKTNNPNNPKTQDNEEDTIHDESYNTAKKILDSLIKLPGTAKFWEDVGGLILRDKVIKTIVYVLRRGIKESVVTFTKTIARQSSKLLLELAEKIGVKELRKIGIELAEKAAEKIAIKSGEKLAEFGIEFGTEVAATAELGPLAIPIDALLFVFDAINMALDIADVAGYEELTYQSTIRKAKEEADTEILKQLKKVRPELEHLPVLGPDDKLTAEELKDTLTKNTTEIMMSDTEKWKKFLVEVNKQNIANDDDKMDTIIGEYFDLNAISVKAQEKICTDQGGKNIKGSCSYKDVSSCVNANTSSASFFHVWNQSEKICQVGTPVPKLLCKQSHLNYNSETNLCDITKEYCLSKGVEWSDKQKDCIDSQTQKFFESIFSDTLVRGLKQVFSMDQYEKCKSDETDTGYFCLKKLGLYGRGTGELANCPSGYKNMLTYCGKGPSTYHNPSRLADCPPGYHNWGASCYRGPSTHGKCKSWCSGGCDCHGPGYTNNGCTCGRGASSLGTSSMTCKSNEVRHGGRCYPKCSAGYTNNGEYCGMGASTRGIGSMSCNYKKRAGDSAGYTGNNKDEVVQWEKSGALCYPVCNKDHNTGGCCTCHSIGGGSSRMKKRIVPYSKKS
jgi:hypothetical protein